MDYEQLFLDQLDVVEQTVRFIGRRHRLSADELDELLSGVRLKLLENDYEVLRKFQGRSSLRTYLTAVIHRYFLDARIARWGKWRPCAQARRLGPVAVMLDQLLTRDGMKFEEAVEVLRTNHRVVVSESELYAMSTQLPTRAGRRFVGEEQLERVAAPASEPGATLDRLEQQSDADHLEQALALALGRLSPEDRLILKLRFQEGFQVSEIARLMQLEQKPLYRRLEHLMKTLRGDLEARGIQPARVSVLLDDPEVDLNPVVGGDAGGNPPLRPSMP